MPLKFHGTIPVKIHWTSDNPFEHTTEMWNSVGKCHWKSMGKCQWKSTTISEVSISGVQSFALWQCWQSAIQTCFSTWRTKLGSQLTTHPLTTRFGGSQALSFAPRLHRLPCGRLRRLRDGRARESYLSIYLSSSLSLYIYEYVSIYINTYIYIYIYIYVYTSLSLYIYILVLIKC